MKIDWLVVAQDIAECARRKAAQDQEKLEGILKLAATVAAKRTLAASL